MGLLFKKIHFILIFEMTSAFTIQIINSLCFLADGQQAKTPGRERVVVCLGTKESYISHISLPTDEVC